MLDSDSKIIGIPFGQCFLESLAKILIEQSTDPLELAQTLVLLPTRRAIINLQGSFQNLFSSSSDLIRESMDSRVTITMKSFGENDTKEKMYCESVQFRMLPRMIALADIESENPLLLPEIDDLPASINNWRRLGLFTQLILKFEPSYTVNRALKAAKSLMHLIDEAETTGIDLLNLEKLVAEDYAEHWQITLRFLKIITHHWPKILKELDAIDPQTRVRQSLLTLSHHWLQHPPKCRVVIAGTTGTVPATAELIKTVLTLPKGQVILPGYDEDPGEIRKMLPHPQHTLQNLVTFLEIDTIHIIPQRTKLATDRQSLIHAAMDNGNLDLEPSFDPSHFPQMIECDTISEEAKVIALMMRYYLDKTTGSITLVSPNQSLCKLVEAELDRWDLVGNSSGGTPLNQTVVGSFLLTIAELWKNFDVSHLLTVLKHPLCMKDRRQSHLENIRYLEKNVLRQPDFDIKNFWELGNKDTLLDRHASLAMTKENTRHCEEPLQVLGRRGNPETNEWLSTLQKILDPLKAINNNTLPLADLLQLHQDIALSLVGDSKENSRLWQQNDGIAAHEFFTNLLKSHHCFPPLSHKSYPAFFSTLIKESAPVREYKGIGSRLMILGALEARLSNSEVIILGGLNENSWPPSIDADPWLSRSMRQALGLPELERRLGLSAHDFCSCFYAKHLLLTRSHSDNGAPTLPSRWWQRLEAVKVKNKEIYLRNDKPWKAWAKSLTPILDPIKIEPPKPCPPVEIRPKKLSVTEIEKLMRDPYSIYAKHCLKLKPLLPLHQPLNPAERGQIIHKILEEHVKFGISPNNHLPQLLDRARAYFLYNPVSRVFWWHRFEQIANWFLKALDDNNVKRCLTEQKGRISFKVQEHDFEITAIADRIDSIDDSAIRIVDYKTGIPPSKSDMQSGYSPQLVLEALIASKGGFTTDTLPNEIAIWHLKGGEPAGNIISLPITEDFLINTESNLLKLLETFLNSNTPYLACPVPEKAPLYNDYAHLERLLEWN